MEEVNKVDNLPSAKELFRYHYQMSSGKECDSRVLNHMKYATEAMIEFAQMHVEAALKKASEEASIDYLGYGGCIVDRESIINAYPLSNIK